MKAMTQRPVAGWYRDPSRRHEHRWWNGSEWTPHVMTLGLRSLDYGGDPAEVAEASEVVEAGEETSTDAAPAVAVDPRRTRWPTAVGGTVLAGAVLLVVGAVLPWAEASSGSASFSSLGIDGNGGATLAAAIGIVALLALGRRQRLAAVLMLAVAAVAGVIAVHDALDISDKADRLMRSVPTASAGVGIGVWATLAGTAIALVGGVMALVTAARPRE